MAFRSVSDSGEMSLLKSRRVLMEWNEYDKIVSVWKQLKNDKIRPFL